MARREGEATRHWLIERRVRDYPLLFLLVFVVAIPLYAATFEAGVDARGQALGSDFVLFWSAAQMALDGVGIDAWDLELISAVQLERHPALSGTIPWGYPPTTLLLVTPMGLLPYPVAFVVWTAVGLVAFLAALRPLVRGLPHAWPAVLAFPGLWLGVAQGQTQFLVSALFGGALLLLAPRPVQAGVLVGLLAIKPHLAVLWPVALLAGRHWRAFAAAAGATVVFLAAAVAAFGFDSLARWSDGLLLIGTGVDAGAFPEHKFVTPFASARTLGLPTPAALALQGVTTAVVVVLVVLVWRRTSDLRLRGSALVIGTFLATPYAADYDLALLAFPLVWLTLLGLEHGWRRGERELLVTAWLLPVVTAPIAFATQVTPAPIVVGLLLHRVWARTADLRATASDPAGHGRT